MIKIVIVEDHALFRKGIVSHFKNIDDFEVIGEFANGKEYIDKIPSIECDIVLMDIEMPLLNGIETTKQSKILKPKLSIIALSMFSDQMYYYEMIKAGVSGFVLKEASPEELEKAIRDVYAGLGFFSPKLIHQAIVNLPEIEKKQQLIKELQITDREMEVLELICQGLSNNEISEKIFLSPRTVETHRAKLLRKTDTKNTSGLIIYAIKNKVIEI